METVIIVIHLMVVAALVAVVLLQRSEGGALGIGGQNAFLSSRAQGNVLTRSTAILAAVFFATSIGLALLSRFEEKPSSILDTVNVPAATAPVAPAPATTPAAPATVPAAPATTAPAAETPAIDLQGITPPPAAGADTTNTPVAPVPPATETNPATPAAPAIPATP
ncbi:MAG TPA: preprotein translocase subunit SecG [Bauldia sp.]|nr:preprotein translocase subunit SecG [Bauldia sp.]